MLCIKCQDKLCPIFSELARSRAQSATSRIRGRRKGGRLNSPEFEALFYKGIGSSSLSHEIVATRKGSVLEQCAQAGCPYAQFLMRELIGDTDISGARLVISISDDNYDTSPLRGDLHVSDIIVTITPKGGGQKVSHEFSVEVFTNHDDPVSQSILGRPIVQELGSLDALDLGRTWITRCTQGHHQSCPPAEDSELPSRIIQITHDQERDLTLARLHIASPMEKGRYVALTYCWGHQQTFFLTTENLNFMQNSIKLEELPQTIRDAIHVTRNLGFQYIWVDALCIMQDSESDKADQVSKMQDIFRNSTITVSAERAADCRDGFLGPSRIGAEGEPAIVSEKIRYRSLDGCVGSIQLRKLVHCPEGVQPIHKRGWTYQEHFLSRRILYFGDQLGWRCGSGEDLNFGIATESGNASITADSIPLYLTILDQRFLEGQAWHRLFHPARLLELGLGMFGQGGRDFERKVIASLQSQGSEEEDDDSADHRDEPDSGITKDLDISVMNGLERLIKDPTLQDWIADHQTHRKIRTAIEKDDLPGLIQAFSPGLARIFEVFADQSILSVLDVELRSRLAAAIANVNGMEILNVLVLIVGQIILSLPQNPDAMEFIKGSNRVWVAFKMGNAQALMEAFIVPAIKKLASLYTDPGYGYIFDASSVEKLSEESHGLKTLAELISLSATKTGAVMNMKFAQAHWATVVEEFSQRTLSEPNDRLPALSGIAAEFSHYFQSKYLAGIWESKILEGLLWYKQKGFVPTESSYSSNAIKSHEELRTQPYTAPSWSWASSSEPVTLANVANYTAVSVYRGCSIRLKAEENVYGEVQEGTLHLRGPLAKVNKTWFFETWFGEKEIFHDSDRELASILESGLHPFDYDIHHFWLTELFRQQKFASRTSYGLILSKVSPDVFVRVGYYRRSYTGASYYLGVASIEHVLRVNAFQVTDIRII